MTPTPEQLAAVLRSPNAYTRQGDYSGGFTTQDNFGNEAVRFTIEGDLDGVHLHQHVSAGVGGGSMGSYVRLSQAEALELALALEHAAKAAQW